MRREHHNSKQCVEKRL